MCVCDGLQAAPASPSPKAMNTPFIQVARCHLYKEESGFLEMTDSRAPSKLQDALLGQTVRVPGNDGTMSRGHRGQLRGDPIDPFEHQKDNHIYY